ncbi:type I methionyl aminopeptidase [Treponema parvum]|uniref:Methionine aminopeptidase n=1 Tax=Treponema parvum TaxID=138851 RepID=A0A975EZ26_9SPIR|nr:type I methionyl aminopeptidase [Treponema parvum]QTQ11362.1 type I methionyl aminopeptidase [Treponema parvum]QTQ16700.1 type I methionyl aminopeptidase [Treponema parvum]
MIRLKNDKEIEGIRKSCRLLADMFKVVIPEVKEGISTKRIDDLCKHFILDHGGKPAWYQEDFPGAACVSVNEEVIHGVPSNKKIIRDGDIVSIDVGINLNGFISDSSHTVMVGNVKPQVKKLVEVTGECLAAGIAACIAGNRIHDISKAVYDIARKHGYGVVYEYCGHGVGLDVHEDPNIPNVPGGGANPRIQPGMVLAIEPMINLGTDDVILDEKTGWTVVTADGLPSAHEEHTVAVFSDHTEILSDLGL